MGGPVTAGMPYLVGENGPEIVTFGGDGYVADAASSRKILDQPPTSLTLDPVLAQLVALRSEFAALADAMAAVATRPQQPPVIDVTATSGWRSRHGNVTGRCGQVVDRERPAAA